MSLGVYTGSNDVAFHFAIPMLASLRQHNDMGLPVAFLDFGMSTAQREAIRPHVDLMIPAHSFTERFPGLAERVATAQGLLGKHLARTMKKLAILEAGEFDNFLWLDADTVILEPLSSFVPRLPYSALWASRISRGKIQLQLQADDAAMSRLSESIERRLGLSGTRSFINSGVFAMNAADARGLLRHADFLLGELGEFMFGDQSFINLAAWANGLEVAEMDRRVNVCVPAAFAGEVEVRCTADGPFMLIDGQRPWLYHFLNYKPAPGKSPTAPADRAVQQFYEACCSHALKYDLAL
jgi:hypothetical protein